jgi:3-oxoacyl-[acyl-carrier protein] reductase
VDLGIKGRTALVTASSKGLGRGTALALAAEGANLLITARGPEALRKTADELRALGADVVAVPADVTSPEVPQQLVDEAVERFGGIDILIGNAGGPPPARALELTDEALGQALNANLMTSVRLVRAAVPHMTAAGWGRICLITSSSIKAPIPTLAASNTARTALWVWATTAAADLAGSGVTMNLICPGLHATDRVKELGASNMRMGDPEDFGRAAAFLCSEAANFISGTTLLVDGAASVIPT